MNRFREKLQRFMTGRYGMDQLGKALSWLVLILLVCNLIFRNAVFYWLTLALLIWCYYRVFSKNYARRSAENTAYLNFTSGLRRKFTQKKQESMDKEHRIFSCPNCKQRIRVPRGKGKISIHCPKCNRDFIKRT